MKKNIKPTHRFETRDEWLAFRQGKIGASDIPIILGLSKFKDPFELWLEKTGQGDASAGNIVAARCGHALEGTIAAMYAEHTGRVVSDLGDYAVVQHKETPWLFCTPDRTAIDKAMGTMVVELKTMSDRMAEAYRKGGDEGDDLHYIQLQYQMFLCGVQHGSIAAIINNREFHCYDFEYDAELIEATLPLVVDFMHCVENNTPPSPGWQKSATAAITRLHPDDNGKAKVMSRRAYLEAKLALDLAELVKSSERQIDASNNLVRQEMGDATYIVSEDGSICFSNKTQIRDGNIIVPKTDENEAALCEAGIPHIVQPAAKFRVLRKIKGVPKDVHMDA